MALRRESTNTHTNKSQGTPETRHTHAQEHQHRAARRRMGSEETHTRAYEAAKNMYVHYSPLRNCRRPTLIQNGAQNGPATLKNSPTLISSAPRRDVCDA